jgi:DNA polymerase-3 subunit delta
LGLAMREARVWGPRERLLERLLPRLRTPATVRLLAAASIVDGVVKGLRHPQWPNDPWDALRRLAQMLTETAKA